MANAEEAIIGASRGLKSHGAAPLAFVIAVFVVWSQQELVRMVYKLFYTIFWAA